MKTHHRTVYSNTAVPNIAVVAPSSVSFDNSSIRTIDNSTAALSDPPPTLPNPSISVSTTQLQIDASKSDVWGHFERNTNAGSMKARCLFCQEELSTPNYATSSLKRHLIFQRHDPKQFGSSANSSSSIKTFNMSKSEKHQLDSLAIDTVVKDARVFGDLQKPVLKKLLDALRSGEIITSLRSNQ